MSRLNWSYLVNNAITGTWKTPRVNFSSYNCILNFGVPFLSGQISSKCLKSSDGRSLSIGTQNLKKKKFLRNCKCKTRKENKPYRVQPISQSLLARLPPNEFLHDLQLILTTGLESAGVVENITIMVIKNKFVVDVMETTLQPQSSRSRSACVKKNVPVNVQPQLKGRVEPD